MRCSSFDGTLATVLTSEDHDAVASLTDSFGGAAWLGANKDPEVHLFLQWLSQDPFELDDFNPFSDDEPDDTGTEGDPADCLALTKDGWIDETCETPHTMICQIELVPALTTFTGDLFDNLANYGTLGKPSR